MRVNCLIRGNAEVLLFSTMRADSDVDKFTFVSGVQDGPGMFAGAGAGPPRAVGSVGGGGSEKALGA